MLAGPNGSGKSTLKNKLRSKFGAEFLGVDLNPDDIESEVRDQGRLSLARFAIAAETEQVREFVASHPLARSAGLTGNEHEVRVDDGALRFGSLQPNSYLASITSALLRTLMMEAKTSFTVETVMSSSDKVELLQEARASGYRTYLYFIATEAADINVSRVAIRVEQGGHDVPADKIVKRYDRTLGLLADAIRETDRAFIFDNSGETSLWLAELTEGRVMELKTDTVPMWFKRAVLDKMAG
jgi:predicted ABC-type ATPase